MSGDTTAKLMRFVGDELLASQAEGLDETTPLLELGVIDSFSIVSLIAFIETEFDITIASAEVTGSNFRDIRSVAALVERCREVGAE